jgi:outer membrane protein TolC
LPHRRPPRIFESVRLTAQAEVAVDYFSIRVQDAQQTLLDNTVKAYQDSYDIEKERFDAGLSSNEDVTQAETLLESVQAQSDDIGILRAQYEHAIALLVGKPPAEFALSALALDTNPPAIPAAMPSELLERRPDIAAAERSMAQANAEIGVAKAAYYPTITLSAAGGFESVSAASWFTWPSRFWSVGPGVAETLFDAGARRGVLQQAQATYDQTIAVYRQTVLTGFVQVEDNLAALRILVGEIQKQDAAVRSAQDNLTLATDRYKVGVDPYLNVVTAQTTLLGNERTALNLRMEQMTDSVQLIEALGGGWDASQLPTEQDVRAGRSPRVAKGCTAGRAQGITMTIFRGSLVAVLAFTLASLPSLAQDKSSQSDIPAAFTAPKPGYDYTKRVEMIPMRDGVKLYTVIVVPKGATHAPILLTRTPYNAAGAHHPD